MLTQFRLLLQESDLGLHCLNKRFLKHLGRLQKQTTFVVIGDIQNGMFIKFFCLLFELMLYVTVKSFLVMS